MPKKAKDYLLDGSYSTSSTLTRGILNLIRQTPTLLRPSANQILIKHFYHVSTDGRLHCLSSILCYWNLELVPSNNIPEF